MVRLQPRSLFEDEPSFEAIEAVTAAAFGQRRKMLRQSLKSLGFPTQTLLEKAELSPTMRAEDVSAEGFCRLANLLGGEAK